MLDLASPSVVYDVHAHSWAYLAADEERYTRLLTWVREQGLTPEDIYRIEVYSIGQPSAHVFEYMRDEQGNRYCAVDHIHATLVDVCSIARRKPYSVILTSLPPDQ